MNQPKLRAPLSPCVRLFLESLLAEDEKQIFVASFVAHQGFPPRAAEIVIPQPCSAQAVVDGRR